MVVVVVISIGVGGGAGGPSLASGSRGMGSIGSMGPTFPPAEPQQQPWTSAGIGRSGTILASFPPTNGSTDASCQTDGAFFFRAHALIAAVASALVFPPNGPGSGGGKPGKPGGETGRLDLRAGGRRDAYECDSRSGRAVQARARWRRVGYRSRAPATRARRGVAEHSCNPQVFPISRSAVSHVFFAQAIWKYDEHCRALFLSGI